MDQAIDWFERWGPLTVAAFSSVAYLAIFRERSTSIITCTTHEPIFQAVISFASIVAGFLTTILAILFSLNGSRTVRELRSAKKFGILTGYIKRATFAALILAVVSLTGVGFCAAQMDTYVKASFILLVLILPYMVASLWRVVHIMHRILDRDYNLPAENKVRRSPA